MAYQNSIILPAQDDGTHELIRSAQAVKKREEAEKAKARKLVAYYKRLRNDFDFFCDEMFRDMVPPAQQAKIKFIKKPHHKLMIKSCQDMFDRWKAKNAPRDLALSMPPRHGKSEIITRLFACFLLAQPGFKLIIVHYEKARACKGFGGPILEMVINSERYRQLTWNPKAGKKIKNKKGRDEYEGAGGYKAGAQASGEYILHNGAVLIIAGMDGSVTGAGFNAMIVDDPFKGKEQAYNPDHRERAWKLWTEHLSTRALDKTSFKILTATRWHQDDLTGRLIESVKDNEFDNLDIINLPAIANDNDPIGRKPGEALWPELFDIAWLEQQRALLGKVFFNANYQGQATTADGADIQERYIKYYDDPAKIQGRDLQWFATFDFAFSLKGDLACFMLFAMAADGHIYVHPHILWEKTTATILTRRIKEFGDLALRHDCFPLEVIADTANGEALFWEMAIKGWQDQGLPFKRLQRIANNKTEFHKDAYQSSKQKRLKPSLFRMQSDVGSIFFPSDRVFQHFDLPNWKEKAKRQMLDFPGGKHDDFVDALALIGLFFKFLVAPENVRPAPKQQIHPFMQDNDPQPQKYAAGF